MDHSIIKSLLSSKFYNENKDRLTANLFVDEAKDLYTILTAAHEKYEHDLSTKDLMALYDIHFPVATVAERGSVEDLVKSVENTSPLLPEVTRDVINDLWRRDRGRTIAHLGIAISEGEYGAVDTLRSLMSSTAADFTQDDLPEPCRLTLDELIELSGNDNRWRFNIPTLSRHVYGLGAGEFMTVFAISNAGKSAFGVSLSAGPGGFCEQGAKVLYIGNEEAVSRTRLRAMVSCSGISAVDISSDQAALKIARQRWEAIEDRIEFIDAQDLELDTIEACIVRACADIVVVDMADKVNISGNYNAGHERLRELYRRLREVSKRTGTGLIGISQASAESEGRTRLSFTMMEGSKIGKASESDLICGIGKHSGDADTDEPDNTRFLTISKNKISGWHGTVAVTLVPELNRYDV